MGISSLQSYQSAQIFEAVGLDRDLVDRYFTNTISRIGGIGLEDIETAVTQNHDRAFDPMGFLPTRPLTAEGFKSCAAVLTRSSIFMIP